jgi:hypothetical protein
MAQAKNETIVVVIVLVAVVFSIYMIFRKFDLSKIGEEAKKALDDAGKALGGMGEQISDFFSDAGESIGDALSFNDPNRLSGKTIDVSDQFGEGATETFSEGTTIDEEGRIDAPQGKELQLAPDDEALVAGFFKREGDLGKTFQKKLAVIDDATRKTAASIAAEFGKLNAELGTPRDDTGLIQPGFTTKDLQLRAINVALNQKNQVFKEKGTHKVVGFGGFGSAIEQEKALREAIEASRKAHPEAFKQIDTKRREALQILGRTELDSQKKSSMK